MTPRLRLLLALYTTAVASGAAVAGEVRPALAMAFALGYQAKSAVEAGRRVRVSVVPRVETFGGSLLRK